MTPGDVLAMAAGPELDEAAHAAFPGIDRSGCCPRCSRQEWSRHALCVCHACGWRGSRDEFPPRAFSGDASAARLLEDALAERSGLDAGYPLQLLRLRLVPDAAADGWLATVQAAPERLRLWAVIRATPEQRTKAALLAAMSQEVAT